MKVSGDHEHIQMLLATVSLTGGGHTEQSSIRLVVRRTDQRRQLACPTFSCAVFRRCAKSCRSRGGEASCFLSPGEPALYCAFIVAWNDPSHFALRSRSPRSPLQPRAIWRVPYVCISILQRCVWVPA